MARFNPPPNWPAPPPGWAPPPDWRPDPAWGPPPPRWQLWVPEPGDGVRPNRTAFGRVGIVAGAVYVAVLLVQAALGIFSDRNSGAAFAAVLLPWLVVSLVVFFSRRRWGWPGLIGLYLGVWLLMGMMTLISRLGTVV